MDGTKRGPGRPSFVEGTARTGMFAIRLSAEEREAIEAAAERDGKPVTQWAREALMQASKPC
jgi:predicted HicB family RNase H-like nuclease